MSNQRIFRRLAVSTRNGLVQSVPQNILGCGNLLCAVAPDVQPPTLGGVFMAICRADELQEVRGDFGEGSPPAWFDPDAPFTLTGSTPGWSVTYPSLTDVPSSTGEPPDASEPEQEITLTQGANSLVGPFQWSCG